MILETCVAEAHVTPPAQGVLGFTVPATFVHRHETYDLDLRQIAQVFGFVFGVESLVEPLAGLAQEFLAILAPKLDSRFYSVFRTKFAPPFA